MSNASKGGKRGSVPQKSSKASLTRRGLSKDKLTNKSSSTATELSKDPAEGEQHSLADEDSVGGVKEEELSFVFRLLTEEDTRCVIEAETPEDIEKILARVLDLQSLDYELRDNITLDCYTTAMWWSRRESLNIEQTSALFTIIHILLDNIGKGMTVRENLSELHKMFINLTTTRKASSSSTATASSAAAAVSAAAVRNPVAGQRQAAATLTNGAEQPRATGVQRISGGPEIGGEGARDGIIQSGVFTVHQADLLASYLCKTLFQHYHLYFNVYNCSRRSHNVCKQILINTPPLSLWPPPLMDAMPESIEHKYIDCNTGEAKSFDEISGVEKHETEEATATVETTATTAAIMEEQHELSSEEQEQMEQELLARMSAEDIQRIIEEVLGEMLEGLEKDVMVRLQAQAQNYINRINRVYIPDC